MLECCFCSFFFKVSYLDWIQTSTPFLTGRPCFSEAHCTSNQLSELLPDAGWEPLPETHKLRRELVGMHTHMRAHTQVNKKKGGVVGRQVRAHTWPACAAGLLYSLCPSPRWLGRRAGEGAWFLLSYGGGHSPDLWPPLWRPLWLQRASWRAACSTTETSCTVQEQETSTKQIRGKLRSVQLVLAAEATTGS